MKAPPAFGRCRALVVGVESAKRANHKWQAAIGVLYENSVISTCGGYQMDLNPENRATTRFEHEATVLIEDYPAGKYYEGRMYNYSRTGMYYESDFAPPVGADIFIGIENSPYSSGHDVYRVQVIWCRELPEGASYFYYGIGVKYQ